ncbi:hypothetical protein VOLCADRAFT_120976 [Volvox carteri f. nagariensis]|uniref:Protein kinase domain-containing protein n=1 Tax=Volvox carteri f. nagariensis TaxID=3068 RepID=D8TZ15_VOLCA|nr:uncharacterized protein VOLCADRAFT_120976 [Volvox carteri f. nagariensis]EFJ47197.1 hypothetical protein VOLCADRAFT_120976 [Volvox carteri f. nagariensis]|eukprot:XP_002951746.1 hypothetical protein VOLCADRAFT_120976 [Volvox carteri f. nagariensis]
MPTNTVIPSPRRELDEALITLPGGTRRNKSSVPAYANAFKGVSRQGRRAETQQVPVHSGASQPLDIQYDMVPGVKLAWAGPASGTYSTTGFGSSPKKYTSQLVGRVSPHYAGTPALQQTMSTPAGNQDQLHLPEIANGNSHSAAHQQGSFRGSNYALPTFQSWTPGTSTPGTASHARRALPYVSTNTSSLAKPLTVQYHPVLRSPSLGPGPGSPYTQPVATASAVAAGPRGTPQRPATDQGSPAQQAAGGVGPGEATRLYPRTAYGGQPHRLPHTPPEVAAEVARLRHAQELDGVIYGIRNELIQAAAPRLDPPVKSKFLQLYEDPNRPLAKLNPKQLLGEVAPSSQHHRRHRPHAIATDKPEVSSDGRPPSPMASSSRSPMYERRLRPLPTDIQEDAAAAQSAADMGDRADNQEIDALPNVHLRPPELPGEAGMRSGHDQGIGAEAEEETESPDRSTPRSSLIDREDTTLTMADFRALSDGGLSVALATAGEGTVGTEGVEQLGAAAEDVAPADGQAAGPQEYGQQQDGSVPPPVILAPSDEAAGASLQGAPEAGVPDQQLDEVLEQAQPRPPAAGPSTEVTAETCPEPAALEYMAGPLPSSDVGVTVQAGAPECAGEAEPESGDAAVPESTPKEDMDLLQDAGGTSSLDRVAGAPSAMPEVCKMDEDGAELGSGDAAKEPESQAAVQAPEIAVVPQGDGDEASPTVSGTGPTDAQEPEGAAAESRQEATADVADLEGAQAGAELNPSGSSECQPLESSETMAISASEATTAADAFVYSLPPGVTPEMARASAVCIQTHARGYQARRRMAVMRKEREAVKAQPEQVLQPEILPSPSTSLTKSEYELPQGVTPEMARAAIVRIQSHARGYFARRHVAELRRGREAGQAALATAVTAATTRKLEGYELKEGVSVEVAEAAAIRVQAHMRGHLARRRVRHMRAELSPSAEPASEPEQEASRGAATGEGPAEEDTTLREQGEAVSNRAGATEPAQPPVASEPEELTIDALKAALDEEQQDADAEAAAALSDAVAEEPAMLDMSDPAAVAAAAAKSAIRLLEDGSYGLDGVVDTTAAVDQTAAEASMARLAASSARTSAMFQGAGAEMRFSDDEASALELIDNLDGLLQGDDEAAAAAAAVAAAAAPADGEMVSISADGVSEPQALGTGGSGGGIAGAYGMVMKCKVRGTEPVQWVAIKEFKIDDNDPDAEDVKRTSLREVAVLEALQHPHVVGFVDKFMVGDRLFIVMEFLPCNLLELLEAQPGGMDRDAVRLIMFQLCSAIAFIHRKGMVYRDIKPENLLVDEHGTVKLCDFGFARYLPSGPSSHLTDYVATRWYRAPELLLGPPYRDALGKHVQYMYGPPVDMWAVGCLMGELLDGEPLFAGDSDLDQLYRVQQILGPMAPSHQYMFYANPHNTGIVFNIKQPMTLGARYRGKVSDVELSFMLGLLEMDPDKRLTGEQCLQHPYLVDLATAANAATTPSPSDSIVATSTNLSVDDGGSGGGDARFPAPLATGGDAGAGPQRGLSKLHANDNGHVVIVEGEVDDEEERGMAGGMAAVKSMSALAEVAAAVSEIEPLDEA